MNTRLIQTQSLAVFESEVRSLLLTNWEQVSYRSGALIPMPAKTRRFKNSARICKSVGLSSRQLRRAFLTVIKNH